MILPKVWIVDTDELGETSFQELTDVTIHKKRANANLWTLDRFNPDSFSYRNHPRLRQSMKQALIDQGLFEDEAEAMLETRKDSYFNATGVRVFYIVPREWIDYHLPLDISVPHELTRVFIGKIVLWDE